MIIEVCGAGFKNKGAELMLHAIVQQVSRWNESYIVAANLRRGNFRSRSQAGLYHKVWIDSRNIPMLRDVIYRGSKLIPRRIRKSLKMIIDDEVDVVFDASGFNYGDQWGKSSLVNLRDDVRRWNMKGRKVIFLPQAFGPFTKPGLQELMREVIGLVDLIFARDIDSYEHLRILSDKLDNLRLSPDFTTLVNGILPENSQEYKSRPCIIPNIRMLDKTSAEVAKSYVEFLKNSIEHLRKNNLDPFVLIHESDDIMVARDLQSLLNRPIEIIKGLNSLQLKGIIGQSLFLIGSRYHGLISALSQGVPCIGTGWSHKYEMLFKDYGCTDYLVSSFTETSDYFHKLEDLISDEKRSEISLELIKVGDNQRELNVKMWSEIANKING